jgi:hypothetical protein
MDLVTVNSHKSDCKGDSIITSIEISKLRQFKKIQCTRKIQLI